MMDSEGLRRAVEEQAQARVRGGMATFASACTPQALLGLRDGHAARPAKFAVVEVRVEGHAGSSEVRYHGRGGAHVLRQRWQRTDGAWKTVHAERVGAESPWWRRVLGRRSAPPSSGGVEMEWR